MARPIILGVVGDSAAGKTTEAAGAYREVVQKYPKSTSFTEAQVRLAELTDGKM